MGGLLPRAATVIIGDFNVIAERGARATTEYLSMMRLFEPLGASDRYRSTYPNVAEDPGYTYDGLQNTMARRFDPDDREKQRLDYLLAYGWQPPTAPGSEIEVILDYRYESSGELQDLSDHYPLAASLAQS